MLESSIVSFNTEYCSLKYTLQKSIHSLSRPFIRSGFYRERSNRGTRILSLGGGRRQDKTPPPSGWGTAVGVVTKVPEALPEQFSELSQPRVAGKLQAENNACQRRGGRCLGRTLAFSCACMKLQQGTAGSWIHSVSLQRRWNGCLAPWEPWLWIRQASAQLFQSPSGCSAMSLPIAEKMQWGWFAEWFLFSQALVWSAVN